MRARTVRAIRKTLKIDNAAKLPKRLFVTWSDPDPANEGRYLEASATSDGAEDGDTVGLYELVATKQMKITRALE